MDFSNYIFRSHMVGNIISVPKPLTPNQSETLADYRKRQAGEGRPLTTTRLRLGTHLSISTTKAKRIS